MEECAVCLDACLSQVNSPYMEAEISGSQTKKIKKLKYECRVHMQVCALLSQLHRHEEALCHAKQAAQISQFLIKDLKDFCHVKYMAALEAKIKED